MFVVVVVVVCFSFLVFLFVEHWLERECVHHEGSFRRTILPRSYISLPFRLKTTVHVLLVRTETKHVF